MVSVTVFGGSGFVGRYLIKELVKTNNLINVVSRDPEKCLFLKTLGHAGQINVIGINYNEEKALDNIISQSDIVINLTGILREQHKNELESVNTQLAKTIANLSRIHQVKKLIHVSALGIEKTANLSRYALSKKLGEEGVLAAFPEACIIRPSIIFGNEDKFINLLIKMVKYFKVIPLVTPKDIKLQPVYVGDVAKLIRKVLTQPQNVSLIELAGPQVYTLDNLIQIIIKMQNKERYVFSLPKWISRLIIAISDKLTPGLLTKDQATLLSVDNIITPRTGVLQFEDFDITPYSFEEIINQGGFG